MTIRSFLRAAALVAVAWVGATGAAQADVRYNFPQQNGAIVDWCATWAANCGTGGANQFCQQRGHPGARNYTVYRPGRTWVIGSGTYCNGPACQGFSQVTCIAAGGPGGPPPTGGSYQQAVPGGMRFYNPQQNGAIVDWCATWATNCGAGGANYFCQQRGYSHARSWDVTRPGRTWVIGSGTYCNGSNCTGFSRVTCVAAGSPGGPAPGGPGAPVRRIDYPTLADSAPVDRCATPGDNCTAGGANAYCQRIGYTSAVNWSYYRPGRTYIIGSNSYCNGPQCEGLLHVTCQR
jgi:hypothetical protein